MERRLWGFNPFSSKYTPVIVERVGDNIMDHNDAKHIYKCP
jgi:hypothetical protein